MTASGSFRRRYAAATPLVDMGATFRRPARYDDELCVRAAVTDPDDRNFGSPIRLRFQSVPRRMTSSGKLGPFPTNDRPRRADNPANQGPCALKSLGSDLNASARSSGRWRCSPVLAAPIWKLNAFPIHFLEAYCSALTDNLFASVGTKEVEVRLFDPARFVVFQCCEFSGARPLGQVSAIFPQVAR